MGLLSRLLGGSDEEEGKEWVDVVVHLEEEYTQKTAEVKFVDGTSEEIIYDTYTERDGVREYKYLDDYYVTPHAFREYYRFSKSYEQEKEVVIENVKSVEVKWEEPLIMTGEYEDHITREKLETLQKEYDIEVLDEDEDELS